MWCEYVNKLIAFSQYILEGHKIDPWYEDETDPLGIINWTIFTIVIIIFIAWWMIPARILLCNPKFKCKRR